jgi:hypothetical protein
MSSTLSLRTLRYLSNNYNNNNNNNGGGYCKVYDRTDFFTTFVQIMLAAIALGSLYIKRLRERPRRNIRTWSLDVSKQGIGACYAHVLNMVRYYGSSLLAA